MSESAEQLAEKVRRALHHIGPGTSAGQRWPGCAGCDAEIALYSLLARLATAETELASVRADRDNWIRIRNEELERATEWAKRADEADAAEARVEAAEQERDELVRLLAVAKEDVWNARDERQRASDLQVAAEGRLEALREALRDASKALTHTHGLLNPRDPECSPELHCYLCATRAALAYPPQQPDAQSVTVHADFVETFLKGVGK